MLFKTKYPLLDKFLNPVNDDSIIYTKEALKLLERDILYFSHKYKINGFPCEDIAQELRFQVWRKLGKYNPKRAGLRTWSNVVMYNRIQDLWQTTVKLNKDMLVSPDRLMLFEDEDNRPFEENLTYQQEEIDLEPCEIIGYLLTSLYDRKEVSDPFEVLKRIRLIEQ